MALRAGNLNPLLPGREQDHHRTWQAYSLGSQMLVTSLLEASHRAVRPRATRGACAGEGGRAEGPGWTAARSPRPRASPLGLQTAPETPLSAELPPLHPVKPDHERDDHWQSSALRAGAPCGTARGN